MRNGCSAGKKQMGWCQNMVAAVVQYSLPRSPHKHSLHFGGKAHLTSCVLMLLTTFACVSMLRFLFLWQPPSPSAGGDGCLPSTTGVSSLSHGVDSSLALAPHRVDSSNMTARERELWKQPDGTGFEACIEFSPEFKQESTRQVVQREKYLMVVVNGGLNQQRKQIVDSVVMARILGASLVMPIMEVVNPVHGDMKSFNDVLAHPVPACMCQKPSSRSQQ